jgi:transposase-like protein
VQRVELITRTKRRRRWSDEEKRAFVAEAFSPGRLGCSLVLIAAASAPRCTA